MTACIDLALALVEKDLGPDVARLVAKKMVVYHRRAGGQSQYSALLELEPRSDRIQSALTYAKEHLDKAPHLSPRQFSRAFRAETGQTPAKAVDGDPWPWERSARSCQARSARGGRRTGLFFVPRGMRHLAAGEKSSPEPLQEGDRGHCRPSGPNQPFEVLRWATVPSNELTGTTLAAGPSLGQDGGWTDRRFSDVREATAIASCRNEPRPEFAMAAALDRRRTWCYPLT
jgi:hypothetical protein